MSDLEKMETAPQPTDGLNPQFPYKMLLCQYAQKSKGQLPVYQTCNEGLQHEPKFRSTVWYDGTSYTSPLTFTQRKEAERHVSRVAFVDIVQKIKEEASHLVCKDSLLCKSILSEYAGRMNLEKPSYQTTRLDAPLPVFVSSLVCNGVTYTGCPGRTKKDAEQLAARAAILSVIDSESGNVMSEIIKSKFKIYAAMEKVKDSCNVQNDTRTAGRRTGDDTDIILSKENKVEVAAATNNIPTPPAIPATCLPLNVVQQPSQEASTAVTKITLVPPVLAQTLFAGTNNMPTAIPSTCLPLNGAQQPSQVASSTAVSSIMSVPPVLEQTLFAGTNIPNSPTISEPWLGRSISIPATHFPQPVLQPPSVEASSGVVIPPITSVTPVAEQIAQATRRKRNRKNKKNAQKKMQVDAQLPMAVLGQIPPCSVAQ